MKDQDAITSRAEEPSVPWEEAKAQMRGYTERDIIELMVRAPAVPKWFEPDMSAYFVPERPNTEPVIDGPTQQFTTPEWREYSRAHYDRDAAKSKESTIQWPRAYALMVLEAK